MVKTKKYPREPYNGIIALVGLILLLAMMVFYIWFGAPKGGEYHEVVKAVVPGARGVR